jgi:hypothetical protein
MMLNRARTISGSALAAHVRELRLAPVFGVFSQRPAGVSSR